MIIFDTFHSSIEVDLQWSSIYETQKDKGGKRKLGFHFRIWLKDTIDEYGGLDVSSGLEVEVYGKLRLIQN